jgi:outer membrane protein TolC
MLKLLLGYPTENLLLLSNSLEEIINDGLFQVKNEKTKTSDITKNIDVKIAENNVDSKKLLYRLEQSKYLPSISAFINGFYTGNNDEFTFSDKSQKWFGSSVFGLNIKLPIFTSFARSAKTQKAKLSLEQAKTNLEETKEKIDLELKAAYNDYALSLENYFTYKENLSLAENIENKNQLKYFEGIITGFELRQIQLQLYNSQNNYLKSIQNMIVKKINLESLINN